MINTTELNANDKPKEYFTADQDTGEARRIGEGEANYSQTLSRYITLVERIRQSRRDTINDVEARELIVIQAQAKVAIERMLRDEASTIKTIATRTSAVNELEAERKRLPLTALQQDTLKKLMPLLENYVEAARVTADLQRQMLVSQGEALVEKKATHSLLETSVAAIISRKALDMAVEDLSGKRRAYKNLAADYTKDAKTEETLLTNDTRHNGYKSLRVLVDEIDANSRGVSTNRSEMAPKSSRKR